MKVLESDADYVSENDSSLYTSVPPAMSSVSIIAIKNFSAESNTTISCMAEDPYEFFRFISNGILLNIVGILGIFGNVISMIILSRPQMRSSINYLLIGLAKVDTLLIITSILLFGLPGIYPYSGFLFKYYFIIYPYIAPGVYPLATIVHTASIYLTITVSVERYVAVCHPLKARSLCTYGRAKIYFAVILIFSIVYNLPRLMESAIQAEYWEEGNITIYCPISSDFRNNELYKTVYIYWCYLIVSNVFPFVSLAFLNIAIYRQVRKANRERQRLSRLQKREIGLATMLLCVVAVFYVCNLLPLVCNTLETFNYNIDSSTTINTSNLLVTINSSVNFIIYVIFGEKFKRLFLVLFCHNLPFRTGRESPDGATHEDSFMSNGDRLSLRLHRQNTSVSRNGFSVRMNNNSHSSGRENRSERVRTSSPGPCVYYPANRNNKEISTFTTQSSISAPD